MHIPDNYLSPQTCAVVTTAMLPVWNRTIKKVKEEVTKAKIPLLGIGAAFSFLLMMFNVPLPGGTTGHAVGGTLLAILLGPYSACISVTVALLIQALLFGDGGILAFGANSFNMAFILPFFGYYVYRFVKNIVKTEKGLFFISVSLGEIKIDNQKIICISPESPLAKAMFGKKKSEIFSINNITQIINNIW